MLKKLKSWRWIHIFITAALIFSISGCAKLQEALEQAIQQYEQSQGTAIVETTVDVEFTGKIQFYSSEDGAYLPLENATVLVSYDDNYQRKGFTDSSGNFYVYGKSLEDVSQVTISASLSGYIAGESVVLNVGTDFHPTHTNVRSNTIYLNENAEESTGGILKGTVSFLFNGVPEAEVTVRDKDTGEEVASVDTNAEGYYTISGLELGTASEPKTYIVSAIKDGEQGEDLFETNSFEVDFYPPSYVKITQDISLEATAEFAAEFQDQEIIHAVLQPTGGDDHDQYQHDNGTQYNGGDEHNESHQGEFNLPDFVDVAIAELIEFKGDESDGFVDIPEDSRPKALIDRDSGRIVFPNIQSGDYVMRVSIGVKGSILGSDEQTIIDSYDYEVSSVAVVDTSSLPSAQIVEIRKEHFADIADAFDKIENIWVENQVLINAGGFNESARQARIVFERNGEVFETYTDDGGMFGMDLPESGSYVFKVFVRDDSGSLPSSPDIEETVDVSSPSDSGYYDPWAWWSNAGHDYVVMINRAFDSEKLDTLNKGVIRGYMKLHGDYDSSLTETIELEVYYSRDDSISFPVTVTGGDFEIEVPFLNDGYQIRVVNSDTYSVSDPGMYYWPSDLYSHGYNDTFDVWIREKGFRFESRIYADSGDIEVGVPDATLKLYTVDDEGNKELVTETTTYSGNKSEKHGEFTLQFNEPSRDYQDYELVISSESGTIATRTLSLWMEFDPHMYDEVFQNYDTNLAGYRWSGFEVKALKFIGQKFPSVTGRLNADGANSEKVKNADVTLTFKGTEFVVTGTTDSEGEFEISDVPAVNSPIEVTVNKGGDIGKVNWEVWFDWNDVDQITRDPNNFFGDVEINNGHSMWVEFNGFELDWMNVDMKFNQGTYGIKGAVMTLVDVNDSEVTVTRSSQTGGNLNGVYVPADGTYDVTIAKTGFTTLSFNDMNLTKNENWNNRGLGYNFTLVPDSLSADDIAGILQSVEVSGTVQFDGLALPGIEIVFKPTYEDTTFTATTDASGEYTIDIPMAGEYEVSIASEGFVEEERTEWFYEHDGTSRSMDFELKVPGDTGGLWVNDYKFEFLGMAEVGENPSAEGYTVTAKIQMWDNGQNVNFTGGDDYEVLLLDPSTEQELTALTHVGFGVWKFDSENEVNGEPVVPASTFEDVNRVKLVVQSVKETSAGTFASVIYPNQHDDYQQDQAEKKLPAPDDVFTYIEDLTARVLQQSDGRARIEVSFSDLWSQVGVQGQYVLAFTNTTTNETDSPDFKVYLWSDGYRSSNTYTTVLDKYLWLEDQNLGDKYPEGVPAGIWKVELFMEDGSGTKLNTYVTVDADADIPWDTEFTGTPDNPQEVGNQQPVEGGEPSPEAGEEAQGGSEGSGEVAPEAGEAQGGSEGSGEVAPEAGEAQGGSEGSGEVAPEAGEAQGGSEGSGEVAPEAGEEAQGGSEGSGEVAPEAGEAQGGSEGSGEVAPEAGGEAQGGSEGSGEVAPEAGGEAQGGSEGGEVAPEAGGEAQGGSEGGEVAPEAGGEAQGGSEGGEPAPEAGGEAQGGSEGSGEVAPEAGEAQGGSEGSGEVAPEAGEAQGGSEGGEVAPEAGGEAQGGSEGSGEVAPEAGEAQGGSEGGEVAPEAGGEAQGGSEGGEVAPEAGGEAQGGSEGGEVAPEAGEAQGGSEGGEQPIQGGS